jgi:hypothetical protein
MINAIYHTFKADYFDRIRRRNYLVTLLCMAMLTMLFFPGSYDSYTTVLIGGYRGVYNSAWIGASLAALNAIVLPVICFYLVKNAVQRDRDRGISELIASTPVGKFEYLAGKWLSNFILLLGVMMMMSLSAIFVQIWHGEVYSIDIGALLLPQILYVMPILAVICAIAILFETIAVLRGGFGNIVYFFLWVALAANFVDESSGIGQIIEQMKQGVNAFDPGNDGTTKIGVSIADNGQSSNIKTFDWQGMTYDFAVLIAMAKLMGLSALLMLGATVVFDRFSKNIDSSTDKVAGNEFALKLTRLAGPVSQLFEAITNPWSFTRLVRQELLLLVRGSSIWWIIIMLGLALAQLIVPIEHVLIVVLPISWILCVLKFSAMGHQEISHDATSLVFSCVSPIKKQFPAMLIAGFLMALMVVSPAFIRFILTGEFFSALMLLSGSLFISSLALACGSLTRTSRTFEIVFTFIWYMGPVQRSGIDFIGVNPVASEQAGAPLMFFVVSMLLLVAALQGRKWQMG